MADHIQKKEKYEEAEDEMPSLEPDIAAYDLIPSEVALKSLHDPSQEEKERTRMTTTSINYLNHIRSREICDTGNNRKVPNIFRDYHLQVYDPVVYDAAPDFVIAGEILFVIYPFNLDGGFSRTLTYKDKDGRLKKMKIKIKMQIQFACYNSNNNSLIVVGSKWDLGSTVIVSLQIEQIKAGLPTENTTICPGDGNMIRSWSFDITNCRGMVYNIRQRLFKVFELKKYTPLFTIAREGDNSFRSRLIFGSPGNMDLFVMMYNKVLAAREEILLRIYSKHTGQLRKRISIPVFPQYSIKNLELCGTDRILLQQSHLGMQILDISAETSKVIKTISEMVGCPYYLSKRNLFICHTQRRGVTSLHVFNLQGEILVTFQDHNLCEPNLWLDSHIPTAEDIMISICCDKENMEPGLQLTINVGSILTGECIGKITAGPSNCSDVRKSALKSLLDISFAYNETTHEIFTGSLLGEICIWSNKLYNDTRMELSSISELPDESSSTHDDDTYNDRSVEEDFDNYNDSSVEEEDDFDSSAEEEEF